MKTSIFYRVLFTTLLVFCIQGLVLAQGSKFVHTATVANSSGTYTVIDNPALNGNPNAVFFVTQNWNPSGGSGVYNNSAIGVWYTGSNWAIFDQDLSPIPEGADFNVFIPFAGSGSFVHTADVSNINLNWTVIDNPALNGDPNAVFIVTQNWNPSGGSGVYNNSSIGVWYTGSNWAIFNQDLSPMPEGADFNILIPSGSDKFVHTAEVSNINSNWTAIDNPALNGEPDGIFFVTQNWSPVGGGGIYNNSPFGVWYTGSNWAIFNQDFISMPEGAAFNIYLATDGVTGVKGDNDAVVESFELGQNYPNPFNPSTTITYQIPENSFVSIKVYDVLGKEVATLVNQEKSKGTYEVNFDASKLSSGFYLYTMSVGKFVESKKMILMK